MMARRTILTVVSGLVLGVALAAIGISPGRANDPLSPSYMPHLGDLMNTMQMRHLKLWFAGRSKNWPLAAYEVDLMMENFQDIGLLFPRVPVADMAMLTEPTKNVAEAIAAKDVEKFSKAYGDMTAACNACHQAIDRGYIVIQVPTASPFNNQVFTPKSP